MLTDERLSPLPAEAGQSRVLADIATLTSDNYLSASFQWIVPASSLAAGSNTFELCGGGENSTSDSITLGENTLAVRISN
jgi:hypothetical protein